MKESNRKRGRRGLVHGFTPLLAGVALLGCAGSAGEPSSGFVNRGVYEAYQPLMARGSFMTGVWGAAFAITPRVAVTNAHNENLLPPDAVLGKSRDYDLLFFRTDRASGAPLGIAQPGAEVVAYGQGQHGELREARGKIEALGAPVRPECDGCAVQRAITFVAEAGRGFSGGPLVDLRTGNVIGVVFGFRDGEFGSIGRRIMYAYDIDLVMAEFERLVPPALR